MYNIYKYIIFIFIHFIHHCPVFDDLRLKYLAPSDSPPNVNTFQLLLRSEDESLIKSLCTYLNQVFKPVKRREQYFDICFVFVLYSYTIDFIQRQEHTFTTSILISSTIKTTDFFV